MRQLFHNIRLVVGVLLMAGICMGLAIILVTGVHQRILGSFMTQEQTAMLSSEFLGCYLLGFQLFAMYTWSVGLWESVWLRNYITSAKLLLNLWLFYSFVVVLCGCATLWSMFTNVDAITENVALMLFRGIHEYYTNPQWKRLWDRIQYGHKCCGVNEFRDWTQASGLPKLADLASNVSSYDGYELEIVESLRELRSSSAWNESPKYFPVPVKPNNVEQSDLIRSQVWNSEQIIAPITCCKHDNFHCYRSYTGWVMPLLNLTQIHGGGCMPLFRQYMSWLINTLLIMLLTTLVFNVIIFYMTKHVVAKYRRNCYRQLDSNISYCDDDGNSLVVVRCPPKVRCIALEDQDTASGYHPHLPNICSGVDPCICCCEYETILKFSDPAKCPHCEGCAGRSNFEAP